MTHRIAPVPGEAFDADLIEVRDDIPYFADDWPWCEMCDRQLGPNNFCDGCEEYVGLTECHGDPFLNRRRAA